MGENEKAVAWWNGLSPQERFDFVFDTWESEGKPEPKEKRKREKRKPKLDLQEVEELAYRSSRGILTNAEQKKVIENGLNFGKLKEYQTAVLRGRARAISQLGFQGSVDEVFEHLQNHA